ncbi:hypothetical protein Q4567_22170 [Aliiglaciecola sp. 2_MG-2023]|uniref:hypothetical protein n=1 Tax=unclassified Aliiglaciecola TaxID=2593648 RepID=UPI0026E2A06F|nr:MULTISPECIES: hypothetical protein [unclassified Aliiglaciecola]MDO6713444.1 hypothetical protein [Aliiglaciecola sp. 2_MG-2023]MDO6754586.1 hypothetical protein [Aliiglaciecola sp. 1_MG-2023]
MKLNIISQHIVGTTAYFILCIFGSFLFISLLGANDSFVVTLGKTLLLALGYLASVAGPFTSYVKGLKAVDGSKWQMSFAIVYILYAIIFTAIVSVAAFFMFGS